MDRMLSRSLDFKALLVRTRAPCELTLSVTPECAGVRTSTLHRSTPTFKGLRSSARFPFTSTCIGHRLGEAGPGRPGNVVWESRVGQLRSRHHNRPGTKKLYFLTPVADCSTRCPVAQQTIPRTDNRRVAPHLNLKLNGFLSIIYAPTIRARKLLPATTRWVCLFSWPKRAGRQGDVP